MFMRTHAEGVVILPIFSQGGNLKVFMSPGHDQENGGKIDYVHNFSDKPQNVIGMELWGGLVNSGEDLIVRAVLEWKEEGGPEINNLPDRLRPIDGCVVMDHDRPSGSYEVAVTCFALELADMEVKDFVGLGLEAIDLSPGRIFNGGTDHMREREAAILTFFAQGQLSLADRW
jgi:hypothetical protein